jgi:hypothetical protein
MSNLDAFKLELERLLKNKSLSGDNWSDPQWQAFHFEHETLTELIEALEKQ